MQQTHNADRPNDLRTHALVVDDHPIVCEGVKELLQQAFPSIAVTVSAGDEGILQEVCGNQWAFVVLDINLPRHNGINILKQAKLRRPDIPIVIFSLFGEDQYAARAVRAGAVAYVSKDRSPQDLVGAVKLALQGIRTSREVLAPPALSNREVQVLHLFAKGMSRKDIARTLAINGKTVSTYKARLLQKLGLRHLVDLIRYADEAKLIE